MSNVKCKVCLSDSVEEIFDSFNTHGKNILDEGDKFQVYRCNHCGLVFLNDIEVNQSYYDKYYQDDYYKEDKKSISFVNLVSNALSKFSINKKQKLILKMLDKKIGRVSILDIGCGTGDFLENLNVSRFDRYGCEINERGYSACIGKGLKVYKGDVFNIDFKNKKFDVVTLWHVLEHVKDPVKLFERVDKVLYEDGILVFQVPNTNSLGFKVGGKYWFHMDSPRHLVLYNKKSVEELCRVSGFEVVSIVNEFYDYPLDLFWSVRKSNLRYVIYPFYIIFKLFSKEHLTFICRKKQSI